MKTQIYEYHLYLFGHKADEYLTLNQVQGQQLSMILTTDPTRKFILIGENMINTSAIEQLIKCESMTYSTDGKQLQIPEIRELTEAEINSQKAFDNFTKKIKLLN